MRTPGPEYLDYTHKIFAAQVEGDRTYPQEASIVSGELDNDENGGDTHATSRTYTRATFEAYFRAADMIVAVGLQMAMQRAVDGVRVRARLRTLGVARKTRSSGAYPAWKAVY